jgi:hypothetical protein
VQEAGHDLKKRRWMSERLMGTTTDIMETPTLRLNKYLRKLRVSLIFWKTRKKWDKLSFWKIA